VAIFFGGLFQKIIDAFGFRVHTQFKRRVMSDFGTQNLDKELEYDDKLITEPKFQWQFFWSDFFRKLFNPSVFEYILNFRGASCLSFGTQNLDKVSDCDDKLITEPKSQWQFFLRCHFRKLFNPSVFE
jgi:hypothetical protein